MEQKPSVGRIVLYHHPGSADGKYPPTISPAIVQKVYDNPLDPGPDPVDLWVFGPKGLHKDGPLYYGEGPCQWSWPPRV
jgi:hypothetical protein